MLCTAASVQAFLPERSEMTTRDWAGLRFLQMLKLARLIKLAHVLSNMRFMKEVKIHTGVSSRYAASGPRATTLCAGGRPHSLCRHASRQQHGVPCAGVGGAELRPCLSSACFPAPALRPPPLAAVPA